MGVIDKIKGIIGSNKSLDNRPVLDDNVAVNVEHLSMEFKITKDKIDTLKRSMLSEP